MNPAKSAIISIGNEILLGKTVNTNLAYLAGELALLGIPVDHCVVIHDDAREIEDALRLLWSKYDIVISTGGLGPTKDDITKHVIAEVFGKPLIFNDQIWQGVQAMFQRRGMIAPEINRDQALIPEGFTALSNIRGTAPGLYFQDQNKAFFALPGVPIEMKYLFETHISTILQRSYQAIPVTQITIHTWNTSESALAERLADIHLEDGVSIAWLPQTGRVDLRLYGTDVNAIDRARHKILELIPDLVWGMNEDDPASALHSILLERGFTLAVAESCTGGMLQQMITACAGASRYFKGGAVVYSNEMKINLLGVDRHTLDRYGAVSEDTAREMASGMLRLSGADFAISITGIAGPQGGMDNKPVGTVCFGLARAQGVTSFTRIFTGDRDEIRHKAAEYALLYLREQLREAHVYQ